MDDLLIVQALIMMMNMLMRKIAVRKMMRSAMDLKRRLEKMRRGRGRRNLFCESGCVLDGKVFGS